MKASIAVQSIPEELQKYANIFIKSGEYKDPFAPPAYIQDIVWLSQTKGSTEVSESTCKELEQWLASREQETNKARQLIDDIMAKHPLPSKDESMHGAVLPEYVISEWFRVLSQPWSHLYERSIESGQRWLNSN